MPLRSISLHLYPSTLFLDLYHYYQFLILFCGNFFFAKINIYIQSYICIYTLLSLSYCMKYSTRVNCVLYLVFLSLNDISWSCSQSAYRNLFIFLTIAQYSIVTMYNSFHNHFPTVGDLGCFHSFIITDNATANNPGHMSYLQSCIFSVSSQKWTYRIIGQALPQFMRCFQILIRILSHEVMYEMPVNRWPCQE